jgi:hypothetical protein
MTATMGLSFVTERCVLKSPVVFHYVVNVMLTKKLLHRRSNAQGSEFFCTNGSSLLVFQLYDVFQSSRCALASLSLANMERFVLIFSALLEQSRIETPPWVGSRSPDGWDQIPCQPGGWILHQPPWSFGFDSQTRGTRENRRTLC